MSATVGAILALFGFALAVFAGLLAGNPPELILQRALAGMVALWLVGMLLGGLLRLVAGEHAEQRRRAVLQESAPGVDGSPPESQAKEERAAATPAPGSTPAPRAG